MAKNQTQDTLLHSYPVLTSLALIHSYPPKPLLEVLDHPRARMVNKRASQEEWSEQIQTIYTPLYQFLQTHSISAATIVTGNFLDFVAKNHPDFLSILHDLVQQKLIYIVADAYWGTSHLNLYYLDWWKDEVEGTLKSIKKHLGIVPDAVYLPLVFRGLPLERLTQDTSIRRFISTKAQKKPIFYETNLQEFRRFHRGKVNWIEEKDNVDIEILYYPQKSYFHMMDIRTSKNPPNLVKTQSMEIGLISSRVTTDIRTPAIQRTSIRIPEERPVNHYNVLQQATLRLWEYATFMLGKEHAEIENIDDDPLMRNLFYVMHHDYLFYLDPVQYSKKRTMPFSSPYEAFVHIQNVIFQLETLLNTK